MMRSLTLMVFSIYSFTIGTVECQDWHFEGINIAYGKPAIQYPGTLSGESAGKAVDGETEHTWSHSTHSYHDVAYWKVSFGDTFVLKGIRIYNKEILQQDYHFKRLARFKVIGGPSETILHDDETTLTPLYNRPVIDIPINSTKEFSTLTVLVPAYTGTNGPDAGHSYVILCEVQAFAISPVKQEFCPPGVAVADLESGKVSSNLPRNIKVAVDSASGDRKCSGSGKLIATFERITEDPCDVCMSEPFYGRRMLKLVLTLASGQGSRNKWMFGIGDSVSSDGYGGDSSTNHYDAEVDGFYPNINLYSNDACKESGDSARFMTTIANALAMGINEVTMYIANGFVRVVSGDIDYRLCSDCLFGLNGQKDVLANGTDVTNYDIHMRFNGVVNGQCGRTGYGLCRVEASWVCARDDKY